MDILKINDDEFNLEQFTRETKSKTEEVVFQLNNLINQDNDWFTTVTSFLIKLSASQARNSLVESGILFTVKNNWENIKPEIKEAYKNDFYFWANYYQELAGNEAQAQRTIDNKIRLYNYFFSANKISHAKNLTIEGKKVEVDLSKVNPSKLLAVAGLANKEGRIPNEILEVLVNEKSTKKQIIECIANYNDNPKLKVQPPKDEEFTPVPTNINKSFIFTNEYGIN